MEKYRFINVDGIDIKISNPEKILFPKLKMTKWDYVLIIARLAQYLLPYCKNRLITTIRFPDGPEGKFFYQKNAPSYRPQWIETYKVKNTEYVLLNNIQTLIWFANLACLEFHVSFNQILNEDIPTELVYDIDPSVPGFLKVIDVALETQKVLKQLDLNCFVKTSGASGLQVYVPIKSGYTYEQTKKINLFIANYLVKKRPDIITIERKVKNRGNKVYFDYLQHAKNKTLISAYSPRGVVEGTVSCPVEWGELLNPSFHPSQFTLKNIMKRLEEKGDLFKPLLQEDYRYSLDLILDFVNKR